MKKKIIVIGAGIAGAATAYHLAQNECEVILFEGDLTGQGTRAGAGIVCPWISQRRNKKWYELARCGAHYYEELINGFKQSSSEDIGYSKTGAIAFHESERKRDEQFERTNLKRKRSPEIGQLIRYSRRETSALFPSLTKDFFSLFIEGAARVNGEKLTETLINESKRFHFTYRKEELSLQLNENNELEVNTSKEKMTADAVVIAAGAFAPDLFKQIGFECQIKHQKGQLIHLESSGHPSEAKEVLITPQDYYLLPNEHSLIVGATKEDLELRDTLATEAAAEELVDRASTFYKGIVKSMIKEQRVGFRPSTPDFLPVCGKLNFLENTYFINGLGASGLTTGPFLGRELASLILKNEMSLKKEDYDPNYLFQSFV